MWFQGLWFRGQDSSGFRGQDSSGFRGQDSSGFRGSGLGFTAFGYVGSRLQT